MSKRALLFALLAFLPTAQAAVPGPVVRLSVEPGRVLLHHRDDRQQLLVTAAGNGSQSDRTRLVRYVVADPTVVSVGGDGVVRPLKAGSTTVTVHDGALTTALPVDVKSVQPRPISFANDVVPVLSRAGCNSGACHGSASGKKGFKVSLRGYDPASDFTTLTREQGARRIDLLRPERSLLVLKPTGQVVHEGGKRFEADSPFARTLTRWAGEGARSDLGSVPTPVKLEVSPSFRTFASTGQEQQLLVRATFSDGSIRDVTDLARYASSNEATALPGDSGLVRLPEKGEAAIMVRYASLQAVSQLVVLRVDPTFRWIAPAENNLVDRHVFAKLKAMQILPSDQSSDATFLRRLSYDLIGLPPTPAEVRTFLADTRLDKRQRKIDELLDRPEHAEFWASKWADLLRLRFDLSGDKGTWGLYRWLRDGFAVNKRFDRLVHDLLTADGSTKENAPAGYWRVFNTLDDATEATAQVFLGVRLMCARCHDHPFEKWVQTDYHGFAAFFSQVGRKQGKRANEQVIFRQRTLAQARHPVTGVMLKPRLLDGPTLPLGEDDDARQRLATWLTAKENPFFAKATVNRIWGQLFGRGIIDPVDDIRSSNPPSNPALLEALVKEFVTSDFDVRQLLRTILASRTYQLSAKTNAFNADDRVNFSHAVPRRLTAEQVIDSISQITGIRETYRSRVPGAPTVALPVGGVRAAQLPDRGMTTELLDLFGRPRGDSTCTCERSDEASLTHALALIGGSQVTKRIYDPNGIVARLTRTAGMTTEKVIEEVFLMVVCRPPSDKEQGIAQKHVAGMKNKREEAIQDVVWALLNSREFLFNH